MMTRVIKILRATFIDYLRGIIMKTGFLTVSLFMLVPLLAQAASFDCSKAASATEKLICNNESISKLDEQLNSSYKHALGNTADKDAVKRSQMEWLKQQCACKNENCLFQSYQARIAELSGKSAEVAQAAADPSSVSSKPDSFGDNNKKSVPPLFEKTSSEPLEAIKQFNDFRPIYGTTKLIEGKFYFSQYGKSGNNYDVVSIDIQSQSVRTIAVEHPGATFIAENAKYTVIQTTGTVTRPIVVIDKETGSVVGKLKVSSPVFWARIKNDKLIAVQIGSEKNLITFNLPDLKILKMADIQIDSDMYQSVMIPEWDSNLVILAKNRINIFDESFNLKSSIPLEIEEPGVGNICSKGGLQIVGNKAALIINCGRIQIYDLATGKWDRTIPGYDSFYSLASYQNGYLLTAATTKESTDKLRVFNINTGRETAILPVKGSYLFTVNNYLLSLDFHTSENSPITIYQINREPIVSGTYYLNNLLSSCKQANEIAKSGDFYKAIDLCEAAGIEGVARSNELPAAVSEYVKLYGIWLSSTFARAGDSVAILNRFYNSEEVKPHLAEAMLKAKYFSGEDLNVSSQAQDNIRLQMAKNTLSENERNTEFGKLVTKLVPNYKNVSIDFGAFDNLFHFDGDKVYIGKWQSDVSLQVYNRSNFTLIKTIPIESKNDETQPEITSITSDDNSVFISVHRRFENKSDVDFVEIDKKTLEVVKTAHLGTGVLFAYKNKLYSCTCESYGECNSIELKVQAVTKEQGWTCLSNVFLDQASLIKGSLNDDKNNESYQVVKTGQGDLYDDLKINEYPTAFSSSDTKGTFSKISIKRASDFQPRTIMDLRHSANSPPALYLYKNNLFVGNGRDLLVYDIAQYRLKRYVRNFISNEFDNNCCGVDQNKITRFLVDHDRLLVITFSGKNSKIVNLQDL